MLLKIELDINKPQIVRPASEFAVKNRCPAVVTIPELISHAAISRGVLNGNYKILSTVDWPKGNRSLFDKFRGMPSEALAADGFEILLSQLPRNDAIKEVRFLSQFLKDNFPPTIEIRFVYGFGMPDRKIELFKDYCEALKFIPTPTLVRTTPLTKVPASSGSIEAHQNNIDLIRSLRDVPVKISGNINLKILSGCKAARYGCSFEQARLLFNEITDQGIKKVKATISAPEPASESASESASEESDSE